MFGRKAKPVTQTQAERDAQALANLMASTQSMMTQFATNARR